MPKAKKSSTVPPVMQEKFDRITALTDAFAEHHLNAEYAALIRLATAALCRKRPSPLLTGKETTWACGITHAIGTANFLFDSTQKLHIAPSELYKAFGIAASTGQGKSKIIRDTLKISQMDSDWCLPSRIASNPMAWMIMVNGFIMDARSLPRPLQEIAYAQGVIPYIPDAQGNPISTPVETPVEMPVETPVEMLVETPIANSTESATNTNALYTFEVYLVDGPMTEKFIKKNKVVSRTIVIQGTQTLAELHRILFQAFNREEEHMYEFQVGGTGPYDPEAQRYVLPMMMDDDFAEGKPPKAVTQSLINSIGLVVGQGFGYWFDFGDDWRHQINVLSIDPNIPKGEYPKITDRTGSSPPQYTDFD